MSSWLMFGTSGAEELCESLSCKCHIALFSKGERLHGEKPSRQRKKVIEEKHSTYQDTVLIKTLGPQENGLEVYTHVHICFPQSLTFLPSFRSPCESPFPPTPTVLCLFMSHRHSFLYVSLHPSQSQHWVEATREKQGKQFCQFFSSCDQTNSKNHNHQHHHNKNGCVEAQ